MRFAEKVLVQDTVRSPEARQIAKLKVIRNVLLDVYMKIDELLREMKR